MDGSYSRNHLLNLRNLLKPEFEDLFMKKTVDYISYKILNHFIKNKDDLTGADFEIDKQMFMVINISELYSYRTKTLESALLENYNFHFKDSQDWIIRNMLKPRFPEFSFKVYGETLFVDWS
jgi:hypothetical protein